MSTVAHAAQVGCLCTPRNAQLQPSAAFPVHYLPGHAWGSLWPGRCPSATQVQDGGVQWHELPGGPAHSSLRFQETAVQADVRPVLVKAVDADVANADIG